jgi:hypothetical protein
MREMLYPRCTCDCHQDGVKVRHCEPCCEVTYEKFIDKDGKVDLIRFNNKLKESRESYRKEENYNEAYKEFLRKEKRKS